MLKIIKYMKGQGATILIIVCLLFVQAMCDLALPQYTSNIIDIGIQNGGIERVTPTVIRASEAEMLKMFMTEDEANRFDEVYDQDGDLYRLNVTDKDALDALDETFLMAIIMNKNMAQVEETSLKEMLATYMQVDAQTLENVSIEDIGAQLGMTFDTWENEEKAEDGTVTVTTYVDVRGMFKGMLEAGRISNEDIISLRGEMEEQFETVGTSLLDSMAIAYVKGEYEAVGVDLDKLQTEYLLRAGAKMLGMALVMALTAIAVGFFASKVGARIGLNLRKQIFSKVIGFSNAEMDQFSTASLITRSTNDIQQIQMVCVMLLRMVAYAPILGIGGVIKVVNTGAGMGYIIALAVIVIIGFVMLLMSIALPKFKMMQKLVDRLNLVSREILTGLSVIRAFGREKWEEKRFDEANNDLTKTMLFTNRVMNFMMPIMMLIMNGLSVLIVWVASHKIDAGTLQVGAMTAFITYSMMIVISFLILTAISIMLPRAGVAAERIDQVLTTKETILDQQDAKELKEIKGVVKFNHVHFKYPGAEEDVLEDIDFVAEPGKTTAIIGSTGSGKSTLIHLIPRFYDATQGSITIDGVDVKDMKQKMLRKHIGFVPQKGVLFSGTIASNLRFGKEDATDEEVRKAAEIAQAADFIKEKHDGYESNIAQGGSNVSGGQKQRLSIARAIAKNPAIYIFDDSFSALDYKTDVALRKALGKNMKNSTVIIVAQRISTIIHADQILVLDEGKIVGQGTHEALMENCQVYQQIAKSQLSEAELGVEKTGKEENSHE